MTKKELRNIYRQKRLAISAKEKMKLDDLLLIKFQQLFFNEVQCVFTYWPKEDTHEPNTHLITNYLRHMIPALQIAYPVCDVTTGNMQAILINEETDYYTNSLGITEPKEGQVLDPQIIDLAFVPLMIYDAAGYRVGYGKGFYDKYLTQCREDIIKTGLSYFDPVDKIDDKNAFDIPLNYCVTPEKIYEF